MSNTQKQVNAKVIQLIAKFTTSPKQLILQLFKLYSSFKTEQQKFYVKNPILMCLETQHDWENILICLKYWKDLEKYQKQFYARMKKRVNQQAITSISAADVKKQIPRLVQKYYQIAQRRPSIIDKIQQYLDGKPSKSFNKQIAKVDKNQIIRKANESKHLSNNNKTDNIIQQIKQAPILQTKPPQQRKMTLGMLRNTQANKNVVPQRSGTTGVRPLKTRLTFGMSDHLINLSKHHGPDGAKKLQIPAQPMQKQQIISETLQNQNIIQMKQQIKQNDVQKKQQPTPRINIFKTQKKQLQPNQEIIQSCTRSITPHKPLLERKKIELKRPTVILGQQQLEEDINFYDQIDQNQYDQNLNQVSQKKHGSQRKNRNNSQINNCQQKQLMDQIQKQMKQKKEMFDKEERNKENHKLNQQKYISKSNQDKYNVDKNIKNTPFDKGTNFFDKNLSRNIFQTNQTKTSIQKKQIKRPVMENEMMKKIEKKPFQQYQKQPNGQFEDQIDRKQETNQNNVKQLNRNKKQQNKFFKKQPAIIITRNQDQLFSQSQKAFLKLQPLRQDQVNINNLKKMFKKNCLFKFNEYLKNQIRNLNQQQSQGQIVK